MMKYLIVLFSCLVLVYSCQNNYEANTSDSEIQETDQEEQGLLSYFGPTDFNPITGDTIHHKVFDFKLTNQEGEEVTLETYDNKILLTCFFFTSCPSICPKMTSQMKRFQSNLAEADDVEILFISVDPETDTVEKLKAYTEQFDINTANWSFLTGSKARIYDLGVNGFSLAVEEDVMAPGGFLHSQMAVLVDKDRHIRAMFDATNTDEVNKIEEAINLLRLEE